MRRILPPLAALVLAACLLGACNASFSAVAASVGGVSISQSRFNQELKAVSSDSGFRCVLTSGGRESTSGAGTDTYSTTFSAQVLTTLVEGQALQAAVRRQHLVVGSFARTLGTSELDQAFAPGGTNDASCTTPAATVLADLPTAVRSALVELQADQAVLAAHLDGVALTPAGVAAWAMTHPSAATLTCIDLAAFPSKAAASSFATTLGATGNFAAAATAASAQPESGCLAASSLPSGLGAVVANLALGVLSAPASYQSEWLIFKVTSRKAATGTEAATLLLSSLSSKATAVIDGALGTAHVVVDPTYGSWGKVSGTYQVVPPKGPAAGLLLNPTAATVAASSSSGLG